MFLKKIDVIGFKSFADKTNVEFSPGITAVVGPNGSGKSNIADAIRWVLGEQSARNLRGSKMEDVIFAGSDSRKATNFCEVSLTLDNADGHLPVEFNEVVVTRRVYRSGESEYLINKKTCRLKDISELFMDSGMGRESYSIIGQGRIEEMLSTRPEDRRGPFEDAAGIVKYKFRRRESERKLEETAANIVRVDDILSELERQAGPLEKEAERATIYKEYQEELTSLDVSLLVHEIEQLRSRWTDMGATVARFAEMRQTASQVLASLESQLTQERAAFDAKNTEAEEVQRHLLAAVEDRQRADGHLGLLRERLNNSRQSKEDRARLLEQLHEEMDQLEQQIATLTDRRGKVHSQLEIKSSDLEAAVHAVDPMERQRLESEIQNLNSELIEAHHHAAALRNELKMSEESLVQDDKKKLRLEADQQRWEQEIASFEASAGALQQKHTEMGQELSSYEREVDGISDKLKSIAQDEANNAAQIHQLQSQIASLQSKFELLKELEEGYDGYALGVKTVLQQADKGKLSGIHGALASLVHVPRQYETAVETALAGTLQNIVVGTEADARAAIDLLKQRHAGRATFMPLSVIRGRSISHQELAKIQSQAGYIGVASELVTCDPEYREVVRHLLGNVLVTEKLIHANDIARKLEYRVRIVTLEGDVVSPGGVMSGGSHSRKGPGLLGRSREKSEIEQKIRDADTLLSQALNRKTVLRGEMTEQQKRQQVISQQLIDTRNAMGSVLTQIREAETNVQNAQDRLQGILWEVNQLSSGTESRNARLVEARLQLELTDGKLSEIEGFLAEKRTELQERDKIVESAQESLTALRVEVATLRQETEVIKGQLADLRDRKQKLEARGDGLRTDMANFEQSALECARDIEATEGQVSQLAGSVRDLEARLTVLKQERQFTEGKVAGAEKAVRSQQQEVSSVDEQLHRAEVMAERTDMELNHALLKIGESYHMTYEWAKEHYPRIENPEDAKKAAESLRRKMASLGEVQLSAIDEWRRLSERMHFLQSERADLDKARIDLEGYIAEIDEEMSRRFMQAFEAIRTEFQISFRNLFGGGRADLTLTDPENVLATGIDVIAQPPGKKLQNLNLLSGGERALTAMALLFAILKVRPVPFCVLDEVEAALDEANVSRFAQQLRRFSDETQFIVITHRRGTMEEADALYGVTMQESGISTLIGVRLADMDSESESA